jgi:hypothetical protein
MMPLSRGLSSGRTLARGHREACWGLKIWSFHPHDSTKTHKRVDKEGFKTATKPFP